MNLGQAVWLALGVLALAWEGVGLSGKVAKVQPLTVILRDHLMKRLWPVRLGVVMGLVWLLLHFTINLP